MDIWLIKRALAEGSGNHAEMRAATGGLAAACWEDVKGVHRYDYFANPPNIELDLDASCVRLTCIRTLRGASCEWAAAPFHYVVETDVLQEREDDFNAWYEQEHLPGLARVPGTLRAMRYKASEGSPRYYACYDIASLDVFGSPEWLAVRATPWSARVRPAFRNTRRTMFRRA